MPPLVTGPQISQVTRHTLFSRRRVSVLGNELFLIVDELLLRMGISLPQHGAPSEERTDRRPGRGSAEMRMSPYLRGSGWLNFDST